MSTITRILTWTAIATAVLLAAGVCLGLGLIDALPPADAAVFQFGETQLTMQQLGWSQWLAVGGALVLAGVITTLVLALVLPLTLLGLALGLGLPLLILAGTGALLALPLVLPVLLIVWLVRERKPAVSAQ